MSPSESVANSIDQVQLSQTSSKARIVGSCATHLAVQVHTLSQSDTVETLKRVDDQIAETAAQGCIERSVRKGQLHRRTKCQGAPKPLA